MRIGGVDPQTLPNEVLLVLPRGEGEIVFRAQGVPDYEPFNKVCPEPKAPVIHKPKIGWVDNLEDLGYKDMMATYGKKRLAWLIVLSLAPSDITWDTVDIKNPKTWENWADDLKKAGFNQVECNRVQQLVFQANCLDEEKLEQARESFLVGQQSTQSESSGPSTGPVPTPSGKPASE